MFYKIRVCLIVLSLLCISVYSNENIKNNLKQEYQYFYNNNYFLSFRILKEISEKEKKFLSVNKTIFKRNHYIVKCSFNYRF
jgi:hypothetical protein